tara:strand:- start:2270 stop:4255 length:1986 start_codon:yes stop_codon:yes gene_type:complete
MFRSHSNFWLGDWNSNEDVLTGKVSEGKDYVKLASTLRAVGNFVQIVTGQNIPVKFEGSDSFTDGKKVTISANVKDNNFDATVGLALHEGSHIKLSDFKLLNNLGIHTKDLTREDVDSWTVQTRVKDIMNVVEDRRIDNFIYTSAPGYRPYYDSMYNKYFNSKSIDKGLKSTEYRTEDWESYMFRLINITNKNRDLDALEGLREIWRLLDLGNISRLKTSNDALEVAKEIYLVIDTCIMGAEAKKQEEEDPSDCNCENGESGQSKESKTPEGQCNDDGSTAEGENAKGGNGGNVELTSREKGMLNNAVRKQKDFMNGDVKKSRMSKADKKKVEAISKSGASAKEVGKGANGNWNAWKKPTVDCIVIEKFNKELIDASVYDCLLYDSSEYGVKNANYQQDTINRGIRLGTMLGRKLEVRNQANTLKYNRLRTGKLDRRAVASLGYGAEAVFQKVLTSSHNDVCLHLSIDASGSMNGDRWRNAQVAAVAIAKAASMTNNMNVVISYRSIVGDGGNGNCKPLMFIAYDSRTDKFSKITQLFKYLRAGGTTPAGLCFEAIQDKITNMGDKSTDKYFINFSDGEPYFEAGAFAYWGDNADTHTRKQVMNMKAAGIKVLSYFIDGNDLGDRSRASFDKKYGKDSTAYVGVTELIPLAKTLNKTFIER